MGTRGTPGSKSTSKSSEKYACVLAIRKGAWAEWKVDGYGLLAEETAAAFILAEHKRALREMKTALTSQSGTSAWDVVSYIEARIIELEREGE